MPRCKSCLLSFDGTLDPVKELCSACYIQLDESLKHYPVIDFELILTFDLTRPDTSATVSTKAGAYINERASHVEGVIKLLESLANLHNHVQSHVVTLIELDDDEAAFHGDGLRYKVECIYTVEGGDYKDFYDMLCLISQYLCNLDSFNINILKHQQRLPLKQTTVTTA